MTITTKKPAQRRYLSTEKLLNALTVLGNWIGIMIRFARLLLCMILISFITFVLLPLLFLLTLFTGLLVWAAQACYKTR